MREIKVRAYDERTKDLALLRGFKKVGVKRIQLFYYDEDGCETSCTCDMKFITLMQDTGLKDKNGVEIFGGDILEWRFKNMLTGVDTVVRYTVHYSESSACFKTKEHGSVNDTLLLLTMSKDVYVVGNIYENPELVTEVN